MYTHVKNREDFTHLQENFVTDVVRWLVAWGIREQTEVAIFSTPGREPDACVIVMPNATEGAPDLAGSAGPRVAYAVEVRSSNQPSEVCWDDAADISEYLPYADPVVSPELAAAVRVALGVPLLDESNEPIAEVS
jgi:hypothetical protein